jgi:hypothetical protein
MPEFVVSPIEDELCVRIGRVVTRWTVVEQLTSLLLGTCLLADQAAMSVISNALNVSTQAKWIRALISAHPYEDAHNKRINELLARADAIRSERNEIMHGIWDPTGCEPGSAIINTSNLERVEIIRSRLVTARDLDDLLDEIDGWIADYVALGRELGFPRHRGETKSMFFD